MHPEELLISALPAWCKLNDVHFLDIEVKDLGDSKGFGLVTDRALSSKDTFDIPTLLTIPQDLILSAEFIEEHAKVDQHFRQLLSVAGGKSFRGDVLLFLLMQITIASPQHGLNVGLSNPWCEYCKILPRIVPLPTMWMEQERTMLLGTSLETAVNAKMATLLREFEKLQEATNDISWCKKCWWEEQSFTFQDWILVDAWYRSRSLELPIAGESMVPCVDMANHSSEANAYYEQTSNKSATLLLRPNVELEIGSEITISYGASKTDAEMLFSYGFVDEQSMIEGLTLTLEPLPDDPLGKAKIAAFTKPPVVLFTCEHGSCEWKSPFLHFMCLNEEDGLDFKVLQQTDGSRSSLRVFWQGSDVTESTQNFESLTEDHALRDVFQLRVIALLQDRIRQQLERLYESEEVIASLTQSSFLDPNRLGGALRLRKGETSLLEKAFNAVDEQKSHLLESESVLRYLGSMEEERQLELEETNDEDDFS